jgi:hypothetical protein
MFIKSQTDSKLDAEIDAALDELRSSRDDETKYAAALERVSKLQKLKPEDRRLKPPSLDTVLIVGANVFGILWLARYERENVIKSPKALGFVLKPR